MAPYPASAVWSWKTLPLSKLDVLRLMPLRSTTPLDIWFYIYKHFVNSREIIQALLLPNFVFVFVNFWWLRILPSPGTNRLNSKTFENCSICTNWSMKNACPMIVKFKCQNEDRRIATYSSCDNGCSLFILFEARHEREKLSTNRQILCFCHKLWLCPKIGTKAFNCQFAIKYLFLLMILHMFRII